MVVLFNNKKWCTQHCVAILAIAELYKESPSCKLYIAWGITKSKCNTKSEEENCHYITSLGLNARSATSQARL